MPPSISRVQWKIAALALLATAAGSILGKPQPTAVVLGAALVASSVWIYAIVLDAVLLSGARRLALGLTFVKLCGFLALSWWAMRLGAGAVDPLGVAAGITCLPLAAVWEALEARRND
jgi:hypothetical protein